ncbi:MAG: endonuclease MutS2 [Acidobacteriota bacterium]
MSETLAALEFDRILELVASFARSQRGTREVLAALPSFDVEAGPLAFRLSAEVEALVSRTGVVPFSALDESALLESGSAGSLDAADLARVVAFARGACDVRHALADVPLGPELGHVLQRLPAFDGLVAWCDQRLGPGGEILDTASPALARARIARERHRHSIVTALEAVRRRSHRLSAPYTLRRERYCLPVPVSERSEVTGLVLDVSATGATAYVEPLEIVELNNALAEASALVTEEELRVLAEIRATFARRHDEMLAAAADLARLDAVQARVLFGRSAGGTLLAPASGPAFRLAGARHPLLDPGLAELRGHVFGDPGSRRPVVPLDLDFPSDTRVLLLSGPNAGGKTVALKTLGVTALMVHTGIPVLLDPGSYLPALSGVYCHIGDEQSLFSDLSTFTGAMRATADLFRVADADALVLYDELGSGTDPEEGAALAAALLEALVAAGCWTIATAHLVTVAAHVEGLSGAANASMGFDESANRPTYRFQPGLPGRSRGLAIAGECGVPRAIIERARGLLSRASLTLDTYLARLDEERRRFALESDRLAAASKDADIARQRYDAVIADLDKERRAMRDALLAEREALRRQARERFDESLAALLEAGSRGALPGKRRQASLRSLAADLPDEDAGPAGPAPGLAEGMTVRVRGVRGSGVIGKVAGKRVEVQMGDKRIWVEDIACESIAAPVSGRPASPTYTAGGDEPHGELRLLGLSEEDAREQLEQCLDRSALAGVRRLRVVHGHGTGVLRKMVREVLSRHPAVARFTHPAQNRGGTGVTEAELE